MYAIRSYYDPKSGKQPLISDDGNLILAVNGEIYNHKELRKKLNIKYNFQTESDCEIILPLYKEKGVDFIDDLNGIFAFALYDLEKDIYLVARDHIGIIPLYSGVITSYSIHYTKLYESRFPRRSLQASPLPGTREKPLRGCY